jgi:pimeloyl-ACP methyl ester carboxylesterase
MTTLERTLVLVVAGTVLATSAFAQSARDIRGGSPYVAIGMEPAPKLIVDPPLPEGLAQGVFWAQYRVENLRILPVFGVGALEVSPRVGHLHVIVDDLPWWWADASDNNTVDIAGLPPGPHKVTIQLVDANHDIIPGQVVTRSFTIPDRGTTAHPTHDARASNEEVKNMTSLSAVNAMVEAPEARIRTGSIRPFQVRVPEAALADLRARIQATRWPDKETVADGSQGPRLADVQGLVRYWGRGYDWRKAEARLNALPQFMTTIDGLDIHFIHVRSRYPNAMPLILTHGWPGSIFEQLKLIGPLTDPTKYGGRAEDAFDVVIPSLPGFGFSGKPTEVGWNLDRIGRAWDVLMKRLGYMHYVAQGGDWGSGVAEAMGRQAPAGLLGIHVNLPAAVTSEVGAALAGGPIPAGSSEKERAAIENFKAYLQGGGLAYVTMMGARPQAVGYGLTDSPAGLAGWMLVHGGFTKWSYGRDPKQSPTRDDVLDDFTLYWLTNTATSSARIYWENHNGSLVSAAVQKSDQISVPVAITVFPDEIVRIQEKWARSAFRNLIYFHEADQGGHFAMWEHPELFAAELRTAFASLRSSAQATQR